MLNFVNDYSEGAHPRILQRLIETNTVKQPGYGTDTICESATQKICAVCHAPDAQVFFLVGGTQTNRTVIEHVIAPYEAVLAADSAHIATHEAGAIEASGHKVLTLPGNDGKLCAADVRNYIDDFYEDSSYTHMPFPGMIYISQPTEYGTLYSLSELRELSSVARAAHIPLYVDGARLGYGLGSHDNDVTLKDLAELADCFYIGGTKVGALFGEAVVFPRGDAPSQFITRIKRTGALLAKGWLLGIQFDELFGTAEHAHAENLYTELGAHANHLAGKIREALDQFGYTRITPNHTNQIFFVLSQAQLDALSEHAQVNLWEKRADATWIVRVCTSWATREDDVDAFIALLDQCRVHEPVH